MSRDTVNSRELNLKFKRRQIDQMGNFIGLSHTISPNVNDYRRLTLFTGSFCVSHF